MEKITKMVEFAMQKIRVSHLAPIMEGTSNLEQLETTISKYLQANINLVEDGLSLEFLTVDGNNDIHAVFKSPARYEFINEGKPTYTVLTTAYNGNDWTTYNGFFRGYYDLSNYADAIDTVKRRALGELIHIKLFTYDYELYTLRSGDSEPTFLETISTDEKSHYKTLIDWLTSQGLSTQWTGQNNHYIYANVGDMSYLIKVSNRG